jgi:hypothetical protein
VDLEVGVVTGRGGSKGVSPCSWWPASAVGHCGSGEPAT